jgi:DNA-binding NtrC family response regulator
MEILLSLIASGSVKYIVILALAFGLGIAIFRIHINALDAEREKALNENTIRQLNEIVKQKEQQLQQMQEINDKRSEHVNQLIKERNELDEKLKQLEIDLEKKPSAPASNVLKDLFKSLGEKK